MKRFFNSLIKFLAYSAAGIVILLAVAVGLFRLFLPTLPEYQEQIKVWASDAIGMQVEFSGMDARWGLRGPELEFYDAELIRKTTSTRLVAADEVSVGVGLARLLVDRTLVIDRVVVRDTVIEVRQLDGGGWWIQGARAEELLSAPAGNGGQLGEIEIVGEDIELRFLQPGDERPRFIEVPRVQLRRDDTKITLDALARLPEELGRSLDLSAIQLLGAPKSQRSWDVSVEINGVNLVEVAEMLGDRISALTSGTGNIDASLVYARGTVQGATASLDFGDVVFEGGEAFDVEGRVEYGRSSDGWLVAAEELIVDRGVGRKAPASLRVQTSSNKNGETVMLDVRASDLDLADARLFLPWVPEERRSEVEAYVADGTVRDLALTLSDLHHIRPKFNVTADVVDLGFAAVGKWPGIRGLTGVMRGSNTSGNIDIASTDVIITSPVMFAEPLSLDGIEGILIWRESNEGYKFTSDSIRITSSALDSQSNVEIVVPDESAPIIDLAATFSVDDIALAKRYIPQNVVKPKLYDWFQNALESGSIPRGSAVFYGPLDKFPFDNDEGRFLLQANVRNASMKYQPLWPAANLLDVDVVIDNTRLYTERGQSASTGNRIVDAKIEIADLRNPVLTINALATGTLETVRQFVLQSPLTNMLGGQADRISVEGDASFDLDLMIPIRSVRDFEVTTRIRTGNGSMQVAGFPAPVTDISGVVTVTRDTIQSESMGGTFLGRPITIDLHSATDDEPLFKAIASVRGVVTAEALVTELGLPLDDVIGGQSEYSLDLKFPKRNEESTTPMTFAIATDLEGMEIKLPEPLGKSAGSQVGLAAGIYLVDGGERIETSGMAGESVAWQLSVARAGDEWDFDRGVLALGGELVEPAETRGLHIRGSAAEVRFEDWLNMSRSGETQSGTADRIRSVDLKISDLYLLGQHLVDHRITIDRSARDWLVQFEGDSIAGSVFVPYDFFGDRALVLDMDRLYLPGDEQVEETDEGSTVDPRRLPPISIKAADFALGSRHLGAVETELRKTDAGLETDAILAKDDTFDVVGNGGWIVDEADPLGQRTYLKATLTSRDVRTTMARLDYDPGIESGDMAILLDVSWSGGPGDDYLATLDGELQARFGTGQLYEVDPGAGRMFGLMSIAALPRRLSLDFRDVFDKGFGFDKIGGTFRIEDGEAMTCNLSLQGPAADIGIVGRTDLVDGYYDQSAVVSANVGSTLPIVGAVVAGPQAAAAMFLFSQIFKKPLQEVGQIYYGIKGPWDEPVIENSNAEQFARVGEFAGCLDDSE